MLDDVENEPVTETQVEEQPEVAPAAEEPSTPEVQKAAPSKEADVQRNFRLLRERAEQAERERDEVIARTRPQQPVEEQEEDLSINLGADDLAEGKHIEKLTKKIKKLTEKVESFEKRTAASTDDLRIRTEMPDFYSVVSKENLAAFAEQNPEMAEALAATPNLYAKAKSVYTMIKKLGIAGEQPVNDDKARIARNASKPVPSASIPKSSSSPLSQVNMFENGITESVQKQLYKEMMDSINS